MSGLRTSGWAKLLAWVLMAAAVFGAANMALDLADAFYYLDYESYQDTRDFRVLLRGRMGQVASLWTTEAQLAGGFELSYVEEQQLTQERKTLSEALQPENTNFRFLIRDVNGKEVSSGLQGGEALPSPVWYGFFVEGERYASSLTRHTEAYAYWVEPAAFTAKAFAGYKAAGKTVYIIECGVTVNWGEEHRDFIVDEFFALALRFREAKANFEIWVAKTIALLAAAFLCFLYILWASGHERDAEGITPTWQEKAPFELYALIMAFGIGLCLSGAVDGWEYLYYSNPQTEEQFAKLGVSALCGLFAVLVTLLLRTFAVRLKARAFLKSTLTYYMVKGLWRAVRWVFVRLRDFFFYLPLTWRVIGVFGAYCLGSVVCWGYRYRGWMLFYFLGSLAILFFLCWWTVSFHKLRQGTEAIAAGDLDHRIDHGRMPHDLKAHADTLNHISSGLHNEVEKRMRAERMKAELITNVSHDLKTPLTSIINYVDLLKKEDIENEKARKYIEVLDRKSQRLKRLTEDLVEASKASTGALTVTRERVGMKQLMDQALGEYSEKLAAARLTPVVTLPEKEVYITADGRHLWRILDNLMGNCVKYALPGTRVYLDLTHWAGNVILSVKNISAQQLNIPADQLMERFVRGDKSRTTEGSGLGLSIARSLTDLQGGAFRLEVDGDLFKAVVSFPET